MGAQIMAAFKAIAALPKILSEIKDSINKIANGYTTKEVQEIKADIRKANEEFDNATTKEEMEAAMRKLAAAQSK
jgi:hypothetical protein